MGLFFVDGLRDGEGGHLPGPAAAPRALPGLADRRGPSSPSEPSSSSPPRRIPRRPQSRSGGSATPGGVRRDPGREDGSGPVASLTAPIPTVEQAERDLVGCIAASRHGAELAAAGRVVGSDFYLPAGARVLEAASRPEVVAAPDHDARVALLAELADVDPRWLEECLEGRPSFADVAGASALAVPRRGPPPPGHAGRRRRLQGRQRGRPRGPRAAPRGGGECGLSRPSAAS